jgi:HPt (histidine-containing phosphotransfer) domain-containing protein
MKEILLDFISGLPDRVDQLNRLLEQGQLEELRRVVHQLKGAGGGYGFPQITEAASSAENRVKVREPVESIAQGVKMLVDLIRSVEGYDKARESCGATEGPGHR